mmetsp:Transcript_6345/g.9501  ORF Transcript_6345/g.9501 Transcript_6345/m.9501 type:complete len:303 (+) Transcript_6345:28-936(+)
MHLKTLRQLLYFITLFACLSLSFADGNENVENDEEIDAKSKPFQKFRQTDQTIHEMHRKKIEGEERLRLMDKKGPTRLHSKDEKEKIHFGSKSIEKPKVIRAHYKDQNEFNFEEISHMQHLSGKSDKRLKNERKRDSEGKFVVSEGFDEPMKIHDHKFNGQKRNGNLRGSKQKLSKKKVIVENKEAILFPNDSNHFRRENVHKMGHDATDIEIKKVELCPMSLKIDLKGMDCTEAKTKVEDELFSKPILNRCFKKPSLNLMEGCEGKALANQTEKSAVEILCDFSTNTVCEDVVLNGFEHSA